MSIVISSSLVLSEAEAATDARNPRIGYHNLITSTNVTADEEAEDEPASNIGNPSTYLRWRGETTADQSVYVTLTQAEEVNYFAIAKHNLGSTGATITFQSSTDGTTWTDVTDPRVLSSDNVVIHEFDAVFARYFRLFIEPGTEAPSLAVMYIGQIFVLQRRVYVGHTPFTYGRSTTVSNGRSEAGQFLGRHLRREFRESSVDLQNITPTWYRQNFEPFVEHATTKPWFWSWRPSQYPDEVGYAWTTRDIVPTNQRANGMMQVAISMEGVL